MKIYIKKKNIWKSENLKTSWNFSKKIRKSEKSRNLKKSRICLKINLKIEEKSQNRSFNLFFIFIEKIFCSRFWGKFILSTHSCLKIMFVILPPFSSTLSPECPSYDSQMIFKLPSYEPKWNFWHLKKIEIFPTFFWDSDFDFGSSILIVGFALRFSDFEKFFFGIYFEVFNIFYGNWTIGSAIIFYILFSNFFRFLFTEIFHYYCQQNLWHRRTYRHLKKKLWILINMKNWEIGIWYNTWIRTRIFFSDPFMLITRN